MVLNRIGNKLGNLLQSFKENIMNEDILKGHWHELKGKIRQQWNKITEDQVGEMKGSYEELSGILQKNYGYQKEEAKKEIDRFIENNYKE